MLKYKPTVLIIMDGFGISPPSYANAVTQSEMPFFKGLIKDYPTVLLEASGLSVGLPRGEVGNSEVGHQNIGAGILFYQSLPRINRDINTGAFSKNETLLKVSEEVKKSKEKNLHLIGLLGNGGVHSHNDHLEALLSFCKTQGLKKKNKVFLHLFLDGRDTGKDSGAGFMAKLEKILKSNRSAQVASICGRFYGMDRNKNWDRTEKAYRLMTEGLADKKHKDPIKAIEEYYKENIFDEEIPAISIVDRHNEQLSKIKDGDAAIFFNFRADRARQLTEAFVKPNFRRFERDPIESLEFITFTEYEKDLPVSKVLYPPIIIEKPIARIFSDLNLKQLHIAETEKYAHVTFFLNGLKEDKFPGEERILIPSPAIANYAEKPEMSALEVTKELVKAIKSRKFDFIVVNYANPDMIGHTGDMEATVKAIETVDKCLKDVIEATLGEKGIAFIVSDHGNAEELINLQTGKVDKEHNVYPVPFITVSLDHKGQKISEIEDDLAYVAPIGILSDIAPTILDTIGLGIPPEMTGTNLLA